MIRNYTTKSLHEIERLVNKTGVYPKDWDLIVCSDLAVGVTIGNLEQPTIIVAFMSDEQFLDSLLHELKHLKHFVEGLNTKRNASSALVRQKAQSTSKENQGRLK